MGQEVNVCFAVDHVELFQDMFHASLGERGYNGLRLDQPLRKPGAKAQSRPKGAVRLA